MQDSQSLPEYKCLVLAQAGNVIASLDEDVSGARIVRVHFEDSSRHVDLSPDFKAGFVWLSNFKTNALVLVVVEDRDPFDKELPRFLTRRVGDAFFSSPVGLDKVPPLFECHLRDIDMHFAACRGALDGYRTHLMEKRGRSIKTAR